MKKEAALHTNKHARDTRAVNGAYVTIYGHELEPGDVLQEGDRYDSTSGFWEPASCVGLAIAGNNDFCIWVRPS